MITDKANRENIALATLKEIWVSLLKEQKNADLFASSLADSITRLAKGDEELKSSLVSSAASKFESMICEKICIPSDFEFIAKSDSLDFDDGFNSEMRSKIDQLFDQLPLPEALVTEDERILAHQHFEAEYKKQMESLRSKYAAIYSSKTSTSIHGYNYDDIGLDLLLIDLETELSYEKFWKSRPDLNPLYFRWVNHNFHEYIKEFFFGDRYFVPGRRMSGHSVWTQTEAINILSGYHASRPRSLWRNREEGWLDMISSHSGGSLEALNPQDQPQDHRYKITTFIKWLITRNCDGDIPFEPELILGESYDKIRRKKTPSTKHRTAEINEEKRKSVVDAAFSALMQYSVNEDLDSSVYHFFNKKGMPIASKLAEYLTFSAINYWPELNGKTPLEHETMQRIIAERVIRGVIKAASDAWKIFPDDCGNIEGKPYAQGVWEILLSKREQFWAGIGSGDAPVRHDQALKLIEKYFVAKIGE